MDQPKHTKEPWNFKRVKEFPEWPCEVTASAGLHDVKIVAFCRLHRREADAQRIVDCVNACKGINPGAVPEVIAALEGLLKTWKKRIGTGGDSVNRAVGRRAEEAISKARDIPLDTD